MKILNQSRVETEAATTRRTESCTNRAKMLPRRTEWMYKLSVNTFNQGKLIVNNQQQQPVTDEKPPLS